MYRDRIVRSNKSRKDSKERAKVLPRKKKRQTWKGKNVIFEVGIGFRLSHNGLNE
jgi:hypothetical protein